MKPSTTTSKNFLFLGCLCLFFLGTAAHAAETLRHMTASEPAATDAKKPDVTEENLAPGPEDEQQPQVTITKKGDTTVEEYRVAGRLYMIKITPKHGRPYYLIDDRGDGRFARQEGLDSGVRVPMWVIKKF